MRISIVNLTHSLPFRGCCSGAVIISVSKTFLLADPMSFIYCLRTPEYCKIFSMAKFMVPQILHNVIFIWKTCSNESTDVHWCFLSKGELTRTICHNRQELCPNWYCQQGSLYIILEKTPCIPCNTFVHTKMYTYTSLKSTTLSHNT